MSLNDLSNPAAVLAAMEECDQLGRDEFLRRYGFGGARSYFLEYDGKRYDSKAIAGVAHKHQFGDPLLSAEFSGGDKTVAAKLTELGFVVTRPNSHWRLAIGALTTRKEVAAEFGGGTQGGIEPSATTNNIMLYSDPSVGEGHGYFDGWASDEPGVYAFSGEGQTGDQSLDSRGNRAVVTHHNTGRVLRLFFTQPGSTGPGGKLQRYVGAFRIDPDRPFEWRKVSDAAEERKVVVFRLLADEVEGYPQQPLLHPSVGAGAMKAQPEIKQCPTSHLLLPSSGYCDDCDRVHTAEEFGSP